MILIVDQEKCDGCGECVHACEAARRSNSSSEGACIKLIAFPDQGLWFPLVCQQCLDSPCGLTCPTGALSRDQVARMVKLDRKRCVGCGMCLVSCPFGAIHLDAEPRKIAKCDLCGGDPACVKRCKGQALVFAPSHTLGKGRRTAAGVKAACVIGGWG